MSAGSADTRAANARSTLVPGRKRVLQRLAPRELPGDSSPGISCSASGFPAAVAISRSATPAAISAPSSARASDSSSGAIAMCSSHGTSSRGASSRAAQTIATPSCPSRRPANRNASREG